MIDAFQNPERRIVAVETGHPFVDRGYEFGVTHLLQIAAAPASDEEWIDRLIDPPDAVTLAAWFAPYQQALMLDDARMPMFQVVPSDECLAQVVKPEKGRPVDEGEEGTEGSVPISYLLPTEALGDKLLNDGSDFFGKRDAVAGVGSALVGPLLYANIVLGTPGGGGYLSLPTDGAALRAQIVGPSLWETIWGNVLPRSFNERLSAGPWPAPCDRTVFPWLDTTLGQMPLRRGAEGAKREVAWPLHPTFVPMARRYRLDRAVEGRCSLSGVVGPTFHSYARWTGGLQYQTDRWFDRHTSKVTTFEPSGNGWAPKAGKDGKPEVGFAKAKRPLRLDDWLEISLVGEAAGPPDPAAKTWRRREQPDVVRAFQARGERLAERLPQDGKGASAMAERLPFRLRVSAALIDKIVQGTTGRDLPLWSVDARFAEDIATRVGRLAGAIEAAGEALRRAAEQAARLGRREGVSMLAEGLKDTLIRTFETDVLKLQAGLVALARQAHARREYGASAADEEYKVMGRVRWAAITHFDDTFLNSGELDAPARHAALARNGLLRSLHTVLRRYGYAREETTVHG